MQSAPFNQASAVATTGSHEAQPVAVAERKPRIKEADLRKRERLMLHYMVYGVEHRTLAEKVLRTYPLLDDNGLQKGEEQRPIAIGEALTLEEAARLCTIRPKHARWLATQPAFRNVLSRDMAAFREGAKARAWRKIDELAHKQGDGSAAWAKVNHQAATTITGEQAGKGSGTTVNVGVNVGIAGYVIDLSPQQKQATDAPAIEAGDSSE